jgi:hypothetical protein
MAGEAVRTAANTQDIIQYVTWGPVTTPTDNVFPFYADKQYIIDAAWIQYTLPVSGVTVQLFRGVPVQNTEDTTAEVITAARDITNAIDCSTADTELTPRAFTIATDNNIIEPGQVVVIDVGGTATNLNASIVMRIRTKSLL